MLRENFRKLIVARDGEAELLEAQYGQDDGGRLSRSATETK
jgi:hypothetical protein